MFGENLLEDRLNLSYSSIRLLFECPQKFYFNSLKKVTFPEPLKYEKVVPLNLYGELAHRIAYWGDLFARQYGRNIDTFFDYLFSLTDGNDSYGIIAADEDVEFISKFLSYPNGRAAFSEVLALLRIFFEEEKRTVKEGGYPVFFTSFFEKNATSSFEVTIFSEKPLFELIVGDERKIPVFFNGRIDRIIRHQNGTRGIVDFKFKRAKARPPKNAEKIFSSIFEKRYEEIADNVLQLLFYSFLLEDKAI